VRVFVLAVSLATELVALSLIVFDARARGGFLVPAGRHQSPAWLHGIAPSLDIGLTPDGFSLLMAAMTVAYGASIVCAPAAKGRWPQLVSGAAIVLAVAAPPLLSADVFGYLAWARLGAHGIDPYTHASIAIGQDPVLPFLLWHHGSSPYGPLFTLGSYALAPLSIADALWSMKVAVGLAAAASLVFLSRVAARLERSTSRAVIVFGLNPLMLVYAIGGAHNDLLLELLVVASILAYTSGAGSRAGASIMAATAIKASGIVMLPFALAASPGPRSVGRGAGLATVAIVAVSLVIFGPVLFGLNTIGAAQHIVARHSIPGEIKYFAGWNSVPRAFSLGAAFALAVAVVYLLVRVRRGSDWLTATGWAYVALLLTSAWTLPWYVTWVLPFAALSEDRRLHLAVWGLTASVVALRAPVILTL
jgi:alpha-1,6-mannosyltransferase